MTIVETTCSVTAGVDTHADVHVTAVVDHVGGVLGVEAFETSAAGCGRLVDWLRAHGEINLVGGRGHRVVWGWPVPAPHSGWDQRRGG